MELRESERERVRVWVETELRLQTMNFVTKNVDFFDLFRTRASNLFHPSNPLKEFLLPIKLQKERISLHSTNEMKIIIHQTLIGTGSVKKKGEIHLSFSFHLKGRSIITFVRKWEGEKRRSESDVSKKKWIVSRKLDGRKEKYEERERDLHSEKWREIREKRWK